MKASRIALILLGVLLLTGCNQPKKPSIRVEGSIRTEEVASLLPVRDIDVYDVPFAASNTDQRIDLYLTEGLYAKRFTGNALSNYYRLMNDEGVFLSDDNNHQIYAYAEEERVIYCVSQYPCNPDTSESFYSPGFFRYGYLILDPDFEDQARPMYQTDNERFSYTGVFHDGAAVVALENAKFGVIDKDGAFLLEPNYDYIHPTIVKDRVIVVNGVNLNDIEKGFFFHPDNFPYYSDQVGVYDLATKSWVIPMAYDIITRIDDDRYFVYDKSESIRMIVDLAQQSQTDVKESYHHLFFYSDEYLLALAGHHVYLVDAATLKPVAVYDRYLAILKYFGLPEEQPISNHKVAAKDQYSFNFDYRGRPDDHDIIQDGGVFVVRWGDYFGDVKDPYRIVDHTGEIIFSFPKTHIVEEGAYDKDSLISTYFDYETKGYYDTSGSIVLDGYDYVSSVVGGVSIVGKRVANPNYSIQSSWVYYTYYAKENVLKQIDFGLNIGNDVVWDNGSFVTEPVLTEVLPGLFHLRVSDRHWIHGFLVNAIGEILLSDVFGIFEGSLKPFMQEQNLHANDIVGIDGIFLIPHRYAVLERSEVPNSSAVPIVSFDERIVGFHANFAPFILRFASDAPLQVKLGPTVLESTAYEYDRNLQQFRFTGEYLRNLGPGIHAFTVRCGEESVTLKVIMQRIPATLEEYTLSVFNHTMAGSYTSETLEDFLEIQITNLLTSEAITTLKINGTDVSTLIDDIESKGMVNGLSIYQVHLSSQIGAHLQEGWNVIEIGNQDRLIALRIKYRT